MGLKKIILLHSVNDWYALLREQRLEESFFLQNYEFTHCYAIKLSEEERKLQGPPIKFNKSDLFERLLQTLIAFKPDLLIVHSGFIFRQYSKEIISILSDLKKQIPGIRIGIENQECFYSNIPVLNTLCDGNEEISDLIKQIF